MAKYLAGPMVGQISGKLGNSVFGRGRYGPIIRTKSMPTLVQNSYTAAVRGRVSSLSKAWAAIDPADRESWKTWAQANKKVDRLGSSMVLQPSAAFIQLNARILQAGGTQIDVPPVVESPDALTALSVTAESVAPVANVVFAASPLAAGCCLAVWAALLDNPGQSYYRNRLRLVRISAAAASTPLDISTQLAARFGTLITGQKLVIEAEVWDRTTGLISGRMYADTLVVDS